MDDIAICMAFRANLCYVFAESVSTPCAVLESCFSHFCAAAQASSSDASTSDVAGKTFSSPITASESLLFRVSKTVCRTLAKSNKLPCTCSSRA